MTRKSKQAGGNMPLTHYERTKKFASSEYGTTTLRLSGRSQYQLGECALTVAPLIEDSAYVTPSGYLYDKGVILDYLLTQTQLLKEKRTEYEQWKQKSQHDNETRQQAESVASVSALFDDAQHVVKRQKTVDGRQDKLNELKRTSYWLADAQTDTAPKQFTQPPDRPLSPNSQQPLRRKDLWSVHLLRDASPKDQEDARHGPLVCAVSQKPLRGEVTAYWTDKKSDGHIVLTSVYNDLCASDGLCPLSGKKIKQTRTLQKSGSSFAASGQSIQVKKYTPTIT